MRKIKSFWQETKYFFLGFALGLLWLGFHLVGEITHNNNRPVEQKDDSLQNFMFSNVNHCRMTNEFNYCWLYIDEELITKKKYDGWLALNFPTDEKKLVFFIDGDNYQYHHHNTINPADLIANPTYINHSFLDSFNFTYYATKLRDI